MIASSTLVLRMGRPNCSCSAITCSRMWRVMSCPVLSSTTRIFSPFTIRVRMSSRVMWRLCEASYSRRFAYFLISRSWLMRCSVPQGSCAATSRSVRLQHPEQRLQEVPVMLPGTDRIRVHGLAHLIEARRRDVARRRVEPQARVVPLEVAGGQQLADLRLGVPRQ